jgi:pimeloyl-ACP methyl ester carboxylesterase
MSPHCYRISVASDVPGWRAIPSWCMVAGNDATIPPEAQRAMAARAGAVTAEVPSSHVAVISRPHEVAEVIAAAANAYRFPRLPGARNQAVR